MSVEALQAENKELRFALDKEIDERNKIHESQPAEEIEMDELFTYIKDKKTEPT